VAVNIDLTSKTASIAIVVALEFLFFATAIAYSFQPANAALDTRLWELFIGTNSALFLALNVSGNKPTPPPPVVVGP